MSWCAFIEIYCCTKIYVGKLCKERSVSVTARSEKLLIRLTAGVKSLMWRALSLHSNNFSVPASSQENTVRSTFWLSMLRTKSNLNVSCLLEKNETSWIEKSFFCSALFLSGYPARFHCALINKQPENGSAFFHRIEAQIVREGPFVSAFPTFFNLRCDGNEKLTGGSCKCIITCARHKVLETWWKREWEAVKNCVQVSCKLRTKRYSTNLVISKYFN